MDSVEPVTTTDTINAMPRSILASMRQEAIAAARAQFTDMKTYVVTWIDSAGEPHSHAELSPSEHNWRAVLRHLHFENGALDDAVHIEMDRLDATP